MAKPPREPREPREPPRPPELDEPEKVLLGKCDLMIAQARAMASASGLPSEGFEAAQNENQASAFIACDVLRQLLDKRIQAEPEDALRLIGVVLDWQLGFEIAMWMAMGVDDLRNVATHLGVKGVEAMEKEALVEAVRAAAKKAGGT